MKLFFDRFDAGRQLAQRLRSYADTDSVVLALPRGGVLVGYEVAKQLRVPLDVVIACRVGHPLNKEFTVCAVTENRKRVCAEDGLYGLDEEWIGEEVTLAIDEVARQRQMFGASETIPIKGKTAIIIDDGITTGLTIKAALLMVRAQMPKRIVLGVPVAPYAVVKELSDQVDEVVVLENDKAYKGSVGAYYTYFPKIQDEEVITCLGGYAKHHQKEQSVQRAGNT